MNMSKRIYLSKNWILRKEPSREKKYSLYNIYDNKKYDINRSLFLICEYLQNEATFSDLQTHFNLSGVETKEIMARIEKTWPQIFSYIDNNDDEFYSKNENMNAYPFLDRYKVRLYTFPISAEIHLTDSCNLRCRHCIHSCAPKKSKLLNGVQWLSLFKSLESNKLHRAVLTGGEIFTHPDIDFILYELGKINVRFELLTNALLINQDRAQKLASDNISLSISLDGANAISHEYLRGQGTFDKLIDRLNLLSNKKIPINFSVTIHSRNYNEIIQIYDLAKSFCCNSITFIFLDKHGRAEENDDLHLTNEQREHCLNIMKDLKKKEKDISITIFDPTLGSPQMLQSSEEKGEESDVICCSGGTAHIAISPEGDVYPCVYAFGADIFQAGNIVRQSIKDIWESTSFDLFRGKISLEDLHTCKKCEMRKSCYLKNCRVRAYKYNQDLYGIPSCIKSSNL